MLLAVAGMLVVATTTAVLQCRAATPAAATLPATTRPPAATTSTGEPVTTPVAWEKPGPQTTGPTDRSKLRVVNGVLELKTPGEVVVNVDVTGGISIYADNITLRNFVSRDNIKVFSGTGTLLEDGEVYSTTGSDGISAQDFTARRLHIHDVHDGVRIGENSTIEGCWIHDIGGAGGHSDGIQAAYATPKVIIRGNYIVAGNCTSALNNVHDWLVEENWLSGGGYTVYCNPQARSPRFINNRFSETRHGLVRFWPAGGIWEGNDEGAHQKKKPAPAPASRPTTATRPSGSNGD